MSASKRTPFQDITNGQNQDPKEAKRQRNREYYAKNKDEIAKRRRQARELKKQAASRDALNDDNTACHTPPPGQSGVTQLQYKTPDMAPLVQQTYASQFPQSEPSQFYPDGSLNHSAGVKAIVGCSNVSLDQPATCTLQFDESGSGTILSNTHQGQEQQTGKSWYATLSDEKKAEYILRQRLARQRKNAATRTVVNHAKVSPIQCTPLSNVTMSLANGT